MEEEEEEERLTGDSAMNNGSILELDGNRLVVELHQESDELHLGPSVCAKPATFGLCGWKRVCLDPRCDAEWESACYYTRESG